MEEALIASSDGEDAGASDGEMMRSSAAGDLVDKDLLLDTASAHVTDALSFRDYGDLGPYRAGVMAKNLRSRVDLHRLYYESISVPTARMLLTVAFQLLIFLEQPPWWKEQIKSPTDLPQYHTSESPVLTPSITMSIECVCLVFLIADVGLRRFIHGPDLLSDKWEFWRTFFIVLNVVGLSLASFAYIGDLGTHLNTVLYLRALTRFPVFVLRARRLRRDVMGVLTASRKIGEVLFSVFLLVLTFAWAGFLLFSPNYSDSSEATNFNIDLSSFPRALQSLFVLLTCANFPDVALPAIASSRVSVIFFVGFVISGCWLAQSLVLATVFSAFKERAIHLYGNAQERREKALSRSFKALQAAGGQSTVPGEIFEEFCSRLNHSLFRDHPHLLRDLADSNNDGHVSEEEFQALDHLLKLQETPPIIDIDKIDTSDMGRWRMAVWNLVRRWQFEMGINVLLVLNGFLVIYESAETSIDPDQESFVWVIVDTIMVLLFAAELALRSFAVGSLQKFWRGGGTMEKFDVVVTAVLLLSDAIFISECIFVYPIGRGSSTNLRLVRATLLLRNLRLVRLFRFSSRFRVLLQTVGSLLPLLLRFLRMLFFAALAFAVVGVASFGGLIHEKNPVLKQSAYDPANGAYSYLPINFNDISGGLVLLLALLVQNNWFVLQDAHIAASGTQWARVFFVTWWITGVCVLLNVLVSFVLEAFDAEWKRMQEGESSIRGGFGSVVEGTALHAVDAVSQGAAVSAEGGRVVLLRKQTSDDSHFSED